MTTTCKIKIALKHLDICEVEDCKFARPLSEGEPAVCCFGLRGEGCIYVNREMQYNLRTLTSVEATLAVAKYECDPWWAVETRNDQIDFPVMDSIVEPMMEKVASITGKVYNFIYNGHEYTHYDNSLDFKSCPKCDSVNNELIGYYGTGQGRIACFECQSCFKKFYYHGPE